MKQAVRPAMKQHPAIPERVCLQAGFIIPAAIFLVVVLAALGAYALTISTAQHLSSAQDVQGSRAYHAARSGLEWGIYQALDPTNTTAVAPPNPPWPNFPACPAAVLAINGFNVAVVCVSADFNENTTVRSIRVYSITATATSGTFATPGRIERQLQVTLSKCRATDGAPPDYGCS